MASTDHDAATTSREGPASGETQVPDQKQASAGSDGPKMMSLNIRIAGGARNASRDQLDFVKEVNGDLTLKEAEADLLKEEDFEEGGSTRATWIVAGSLLPRDVPLKDIEKLNRSDGVVVQVFLQSTATEGSEGTTTGRGGSSTVYLDRMDTFEDSVSIFAYSVSGLGLAFTWRYLLHSDRSPVGRDDASSLLQNLTLFCIYAFTLLWVATVVGVLIRNLTPRAEPSSTSTERRDGGPTERTSVAEGMPVDGAAEGDTSVAEVEATVPASAPSRHEEGESPSSPGE
ncbi:hypothetical protein FOZ61_007733 [Perkinsus olseni]|uniref:Uncharacterized protein n=1 Tax=Perkinsus olseni TaxID=32597 RepID=A0A7J6L7L5_PEROL|nr:hypothetical protein FOZ61_007733 [Perkinsus olseni]KAF4662867.1 hypothetical protein FOL46_005090 [Perkinsus olseni]